MNIKELRTSANMNRTEFCRYFNIPYRTVEDWETERRECSKYLIDLIEYKLINEGLIEEDN